MTVNADRPGHGPGRGRRLKSLTSIRTGLLTAALVALTAGAAGAQTSTPFAGDKVNGGTVVHSLKDGKHVLTLSNDFKVPDPPDPHWQVVDSRGNVRP